MSDNPHCAAFARLHLDYFASQDCPSSTLSGILAPSRTTGKLFFRAYYYYVEQCRVHDQITISRYADLWEIFTGQVFGPPKRTHRPAITVQTFLSDSKEDRPDVKLSSSDQSAAAQIIPDKFSVEPGSSQVVRVNFSPPEKVDPRWLAVYSGYIAMVSSSRCPTSDIG